MSWNHNNMSYCWPELSTNKFSIKPDDGFAEVYKNNAYLKNKE